MAESIKCSLEVYSAATFSLSTPRRYLAGVVGDDIVFVVTSAAVGSFTGNLTIAVTGEPSGAVVTLNPVDGIIAHNGTCTVTVDTDACSEVVSTLTITGTPVV